jgi:6-phospho-beta-glucosidase
MAPVVAILGGGAYVARLVELIGASDMPPVELRIHARDRERLRAITHHAAGRLAATAATASTTGARHTVRGCPELGDALAGATAVVLLVRVGGLAARAHDESFPARFDQIGDEGVGLGGMANAWRTLPVLDEMASQIVREAPAAHVLNLMAPLGVTTRLLVEHGLRAIGLCELPTVTLARWRASAGGDPPALHYAGLNHLGFFWSPAMPALEHPVIRAAIAERDTTAELVARLGGVPLHYFVDVFEPTLAQRLGRQRRPGRAHELAALQAVLLQRFVAQPGATADELARRPTPWFELAVVPALAAVLGGPPFVGPLDVPNAGALAEAPREAIVELHGTFDAAVAEPAPIAPRPPAVRDLLARLARAEDALYRAARARDRGLLHTSLEALPLAIPRADREHVLDCVCEAVPP